MKVRCDYCCGKLGLMVHRYWHMRFCSSACTQSYEQRLDETKARMRRLFGSGEYASAKTACSALLQSEFDRTTERLWQVNERNGFGKRTGAAPRAGGAHQTGSVIAE